MRLVGVAHTELLRFDDADGALSEALGLAREYALAPEEAQVMVERARLARAQAAFEDRPAREALNTYSQAGELAGSIGHVACKAEAMFGLARCLIGEGKLDEGTEVLRAAAELVPAAAHGSLRLKCELGLAMAAHGSEELEAAMARYRAVARAARSADLRWILATALAGTGATQLHTAEEGAAHATWEDAQAVAQGVSPLLSELTARSISRCRESLCSPPW